MNQFPDTSEIITIDRTPEVVEERFSVPDYRRRRGDMAMQLGDRAGLLRGGCMSRLIGKIMDATDDEPVIYTDTEVLPLPGAIVQAEMIISIIFTVTPREPELSAPEQKRKNYRRGALQASSIRSARAVENIKNSICVHLSGGRSGKFPCDTCRQIALRNGITIPKPNQEPK